MPTFATVSELITYPIKGLNGVATTCMGIQENGNPIGDRVYTILTAGGEIFRLPKQGLNSFHILPSAISVQMDPLSATGSRIGVIGTHGNIKTLSFEGGEEITGTNFFDDFPGMEGMIITTNQSGNPDDHEAHGPTICSEQSISEVGKWFGLKRAEIIARMRPNIILDAPSENPFWEERELLGPLGTNFRFKIGEVILAGTNVCTRCQIPALDPLTGRRTPGQAFERDFMNHKAPHLLEADIIHGQMNKAHSKTKIPYTYRFAINTASIGPETEGIIQTGDEMTAMGVGS